MKSFYPIPWHGVHMQGLIIMRNHLQLLRGNRFMQARWNEYCLKKKAHCQSGRSARLILKYNRRILGQQQERNLCSDCTQYFYHVGYRAIHEKEERNPCSLSQHGKAYPRARHPFSVFPNRVPVALFDAYYEEVSSGPSPIT